MLYWNRGIKGIFRQMVYIKYLTNTYQKLSKYRQSREKLDILRIFAII